MASPRPTSRADEAAEKRSQVAVSSPREGSVANASDQRRTAAACRPRSAQRRARARRSGLLEGFLGVTWPWLGCDGVD